MLQTVRARMVDGRTEELMGLANGAYQQRLQQQQSGDGPGDWATAERMLLKETFQRQIGCTLSLMSSMTVRLHHVFKLVVAASCVRRTLTARPDLPDRFVCCHGFLFVPYFHTSQGLLKGL